MVNTYINIFNIYIYIGVRWGYVGYAAAYLERKQSLSHIPKTIF